MKPSSFGYTPDPPKPNDPRFSITLAPTLQPTISGDVDLREFATESNQAGLSSCAGNASTDAVEIISAIEGRPRVQLSRLFTYAMARHMQDDDQSGDDDLDVDNGTYLRFCMLALSTYGICAEAAWPYDESKVFDEPSIRAQQEAVGHKIHSYYRIDSTGDQRVQDILLALRGLHPVVFGTDVEDPFRRVDDTTPVDVPKGGTIGGHAMIIAGYLNGNFLVKNSWGAGWGFGGYCFMTPAYVMWENTRDLWVPTMGTTFKVA